MSRVEHQLLLRAPTEADRRPFTAAMRASASFHHPWMTGVCTDPEFDSYLRRSADERQDVNLLCRADDGVIVGFFNLSEIVRGLFHSAYLGYGAVAQYSGQGYMSAGMQLMLGRAFEQLSLHRIEANIQPANGPSLALAKRSGFVKEGFSESYLRINGDWRDHERWAIRVEQWQALQ